MKVFALFIAAAAAIRLDTPNESYAAKADSLAGSMSTVATQQ